MVTMPFRRHKGEPLQALPDHYLHWLLTGASIHSPMLRHALEREWERRLEVEAPAVPAFNVKAFVSEWFRPLALQFHPDRGGSHEAMTALNTARDRLERLLDEQVRVAS